MGTLPWQRMPVPGLPKVAVGKGKAETETEAEAPIQPTELDESEL